MIRILIEVLHDELFGCLWMERSPKAEDDAVVDLNVGGTFYSTTRSTLLRFDSMLNRMFSGRFDLRKRAEDGRVFIDRDGEVFKFVLQYLRDGDLEVEDMDLNLVRRLKREAAFFCLKELENKLKAHLTAEEKRDEKQRPKKAKHFWVKLYLVGKPANVQAEWYVRRKPTDSFDLREVLQGERTLKRAVVNVCDYLSQYNFALVNHACYDRGVSLLMFRGEC
ncbi:BTB/POZ domain-containing protein kctd6 [Balamuthia mandrillaris]